MIRNSYVQLNLMLKAETKDTVGKKKKETGFRYTNTHLYF